MSLLRSAARRLGLGKYRYWQGTDLQGNNFFERPHVDYPDEWRKNKRYVEYREARPLSDYDFKSIPVQWSAWLRRTRRDPPTLEELQKDYARQVRLQENVLQLEQAYKEEKLRLQEANQAALPPGPQFAFAASSGGAGDGLTPEQKSGLPSKDAGTDGRASQVGRVVGTGEEKAVGDRVQPKQESPEETATRRREEERQANLKRREEFARQQAAIPRGNPSDTAQPEGWQPAGPARRR
ncbi:hypothetical protein JCM10213_006104 [Rhodosporidiobolus nylandii]